MVYFIFFVVLSINVVTYIVEKVKKGYNIDILIFILRELNLKNGKRDFCDSSCGTPICSADFISD